MADELRKALELVKSYIKDDLVWSAVIDPDKPATADNSLGALVDAALAASPADAVGEIVALVREQATDFLMEDGVLHKRCGEKVARLADAIASRCSTGDGWNRNMDEAPREFQGSPILIAIQLDTGRRVVREALWTGTGWLLTINRIVIKADSPTLRAWRHLPPAPGETDEA